MSPRLLITGGGGFVGSHLAEGFARLGYAVTALDRSFDDQTRRRLAGVSCVERELDGKSLRALGRFDIVVHAAAITSTPEETGLSEATHMSLNLTLFLDCYTFARDHGARIFVFLSSSGVFSFAEADTLTESVPPRGTSAYALAKRAGEVIAGSLDGCLVARLGPIYGPHETSRPSRLTPSPIRRWLDRLETGQPIRVEQPLSRRDWTYAPDLAPALHRLFQHAGVTGIIHLTSGETLSDRDLALHLGAAFGVTPQVEEAAGAPIRAPMRSERAELADFTWTPLHRGIEQLREVLA